MGEGTSKLEKTERKKEFKLDNNNETGVETNSSPEEIRSQIQDTRHQMGETINEIQDRLSVENITEQVKEEVSDQISTAWQSTKESVYDSALKKTGEVMEYVENGINEISDSKAAETVRKNPIAFTLIGAGLGMILFNVYQGRSSQNKTYSNGRRTLSADNERSRIELAKKKAGDAYSSISETAENAYDTVSETAGQAYKTAGNVVGSAYEAVGSAGIQVKDTAKDLAHKAQDNYDYYIEENPLAVGAVALAVGAAVGLSIPSTNFESKLVGDKRDELMYQASRTVNNLINNKVDQVKEVASHTADTAIKEAEKAVNNTAEKATDEAKNWN